ncbi:uncharacterized protein LOC115951783 [Quercus lobata]|uniref:uncharacterized protein LOC115951783 n=1 Tax=Quercus lobata TaxID=97700 RepID=UPI001246D567|nr:uncharacterized protein LOC115951783 [Quercus lobata]
MARQKANLRTHSKSVTVEGASTQHMNQETNQKMREASTQDVRPPVYATRGPSKYLDVWDLPDDKVIELPLNSMYQPVDEGARAFTGFLGTIARKPHMCLIRYLTWKDIPEELKEECWRLVERKYVVPTNPTAYAALKTFTLQKIRKAWRVHKCRLKTSHYIPHLRNKAWVKNNRPKRCIPEDWDVLVDHWYTDDVVIESEKNRDRRSKQEDLHTAGSCSFAVHAAKKAKANERLVECAALYSILHTRKDGFTVNPAVQAKMDKRKELLAEPSNQLQSSDISGSIAWAPDDVFAKVMGKECKGRIRRVGFGPSLSGRSSKSALTDLQIRSSQERDDEVAQLKASLANMQEKLSSFEEMKERLSQFEEMEKRMAHMLQQMQQITSQCSQVGNNVCLIPLIMLFP